jgi:hypothetical protein
MAIRVQGDIVVFDDKVVRPGRFTTTQRNAITSPANGMIIFNTDLVSFEGYNGTAWAAIAGGTGGADEYARTIAYLAL